MVTVLHRVLDHPGEDFFTISTFPKTTVLVTPKAALLLPLILLLLLLLFIVGVLFSFFSGHCRFSVAPRNVKRQRE